MSFFSINWKEMWLFIKVRIGYGISTFILTVLFVDVFKYSYWKFTLIGMPIELLCGYWLNKYVFQRHKKRKKK